MAEERARPDRTGKRRRLPGFVRRRPFGWAMAAALFACFWVVDLAHGWRLGTLSDASAWLGFALHALALLFPAILALRWRGAGTGARVAALAACALWWMSDSNRTGGSLRALREFAPATRVVSEMLREPRRAMRAEPAAAVEKALAAGDSSFLAVGGQCGSVPGVDTAVARRQGVRVIRGTYHDTPPLTPEHRGFIFFESHNYAENYNYALAERLKIEPIPPGGTRSSCMDVTPLRGRAPLLWP